MNPDYEYLNSHALLRKVLLKIYNLFVVSELKHKEFLLFIFRHWNFIYLTSLLFSTIGNSSEPKYFLHSTYITPKSWAPQAPACPSLSAVLICHLPSPLSDGKIGFLCFLSL